MFKDYSDMTDIRREEKKILETEIDWKMTRDIYVRKIARSVNKGITIKKWFLFSVLMHGKEVKIYK